MPRVHFVKKARKNVPNSDIKKGESYFWWQFAFSKKSVSRSKPRPSQLTRSEFWGNIYGLREGNESLPEESDLSGERDSIRDELQGIKDEIEEKIQSMEQAFPNGCPSLETLNERNDALDSAISDIEGVDCEINEGDDDDRAAEIWNEVLEALDNISCS